MPSLAGPGTRLPPEVTTFWTSKATRSLHLMLSALLCLPSFHQPQICEMHPRFSVYQLFVLLYYCVVTNYTSKLEFSKVKNVTLLQMPVYHIAKILFNSFTYEGISKTLRRGPSENLTSWGL